MSNRPVSVCGVLSAVWLLVSCAVGPDFERPKTANSTVYDSSEASAQTPPAIVQSPQAAAKDAARAPPANLKLDIGAEVPAQWWQLFKSEDLDRIVRLAINDNPTLGSARATLAEAREAVTVARAGYLPHLAANAGLQRSGVGAASSTDAGVQRSGAGAASSTDYSLGLSASYSFNAFGGATRRLVEQQQALADTQRYELAAAYLTLTGGVVTQALTIASARLQIATTLELLADDQKNLDLTTRMFDVGAAARTDVLTAESQLATDEASLPTLRQQLSVARHALAVLVGHGPAEWSAPDFELSQFTLPAAVPVSLPSTLLRQRPDILAAEQQLHAASAGIGIAVANEYPSITLSGALTRDALTAANLFHDFERLWSVGGALTQPIFEGGALRAQSRAARDAFTAQADAYREVVLTAFGQVADSLRALEHDEDRVAAFRHALRIAGDSLALQRISYAAGKTTVLQLIDAERTYSQVMLGMASAQVQQFEDAANLLVAVGGGWWNTSVAPAG
jgi:NodT family efflux transporter outer membrane factor (OMF) lipoprotein